MKVNEGDSLESKEQQLPNKDITAQGQRIFFAILCKNPLSILGISGFCANACICVNHEHLNDR